ncbi:hypothetical protein ATO8_04456 [Roseivivax marinus]|uniref:Kinase n=1 Tax=Roseivivax marinus TaxID=1379903 RepID=W4HQ35_9RHOB|nr:AAA family ATPase [Roseivivax marinus]ETW14115.1 hypothetical protein ATO8_04456 [Roseivivax marinus]
MPALISFAGLPGTGKSTVGRHLAAATGAAFLRVDEIEAVMRARDPGREIADESYRIAAALAVSNLRLGNSAIIDCVNPWPLTRDIFSDAARQAGARFLGVELRCDDRSQHRRRVEGRVLDIPGGFKPTWAEVQERDYVTWTDAAVRIDTAACDPDAAVRVILKALAE